MNIFYPNLSWKTFPILLGYSAVGAFIAGGYGIVHDQFTYSISPEYFTRLKFAQFHYANFGFPPRVFVAEIGFLATWWVGFFAGWFLARVAVPKFPPIETRRYVLRGFVIIFLFAITASLAGYLLGLRLGPISPDSGWAQMAASLGVVEKRDFVRVAYMHNASYLGGLVGLVTAIVYLEKIEAKLLTTRR